MLRYVSTTRIPVAVLLLIIIGVDSCSIYCESPKIPCGNYDHACVGFIDCMTEAECQAELNQGSGNKPATNLTPVYAPGNSQDSSNCNIPWFRYLCPPSNQGSNQGSNSYSGYNNNYPNYNSGYPSWRQNINI